MDADRFDRLVATLAAIGTRRALLRLGAAVPVAGAVLTHLEAVVEGQGNGAIVGGGGRRRRRKARHRHDPGSDKDNEKDQDKRKDKRKRKRKDKRRKSSSPPRTPVPIVTYACSGAGAVEFQPPSTLRLAQTFTAAQSGALLQIEFEIDKAPGSTGDYLVELLATAGGEPTNTVLAAATIRNDTVREGDSVPVTATFSGPPLVAGSEYAAAITRQVGGIGDRLIVSASDNNVCAGRVFFQAPRESGSFLPQAEDLDLHTSVTVLA